MNSTAQHGLATTPADPANHRNAGDARTEFQTLLSDCGVFDLRSRAKISIRGGDRVRWLNGMVTNNVRDLPQGQGVYAFVLNPQGHILGDLYAYNRGDSLIVDTGREQLDPMLAHFDKYIIMDDVEVADVSPNIAALGMAGPSAADVLRRVGLEPPVSPLQVSEVQWQDIGLTLICGDNPAVEGFELWVAPNHQPRLLDALQGAGASAVGTSALELLRIASGMPRYGQDIRERDLPQETEQQRALNFSKGCYIGQEIVERIRSRGNVHRMFTGFEVQGVLPSPGDKIQGDGRDVGEITSTASLPLKTGERRVALGYIRREAAADAKMLTAAGSGLTVSHLPFAGIFA